MVPLLLPLLLLPLATSNTVSSCDSCSLFSKCVLDNNDRLSCLCDAGFTGAHCDIVLCHKYHCFGRLSICENTMQGPMCHCERGRTGSNCELLNGESTPWSRCKNATVCEASFQDGHCDSLCNTAECLYDGNDCEEDASTVTESPRNLPLNGPATAPPLDAPSSSSTEHLLIFICCLLLILVVILSIIIVRLRKGPERVSDYVYTLPATPATIATVPRLRVPHPSPYACLDNAQVVSYRHQDRLSEEGYEAIREAQSLQSIDTTHSNVTDFENVV